MSETYRYRSDIPNRAHIVDIALDVDTGEEFDSPVPLHHGHLVPLNKAAKDAAAAVEQANREMGARWDQEEIDRQQNAPPEPATGGIVRGDQVYLVGDGDPEQIVPGGKAAKE